MPTSEKRIAANRANAQKSTGPRTQRRPGVQEAIEKAELTIVVLPPMDERLIRYQAQMERQYYRAMAKLLSLQTRRDNNTAIERPAPVNQLPVQHRDI